MLPNQSNIAKICQKLTQAYKSLSLLYPATTATTYKLAPYKSPAMHDGILTSAAASESHHAVRHAPG